MSITYPLSLPSSPAPTRVVMKMFTAAAGYDSPFTLQGQHYLHPGERWGAEVTLPPMVRAAAEAWICFLGKLRGTYGTFYLGDPACKTPRGTISGSPTASGTVGATSLTITFTGTLLKGDYIQVGSGSAKRLYKLLDDATTGVAVEVFPRLRETLANAAVTYQSPQGAFRLTSNESDWDVSVAKHFGIGFSAIEAL